MLNNVKANVPGILLAFLNISTQDRKKEEEDQAAPTWEKQKLKKEKKKEKKKRLSEEPHQLPLTSGSHGLLWLQSGW